MNLDCTLLTLLPPSLLNSLTNSHLLPTHPSSRSPSSPLVATDMHLSSSISEKALLNKLLRKDLNVPSHHTVFSWSEPTANNTVPLGHTSYTFPPLPSSPSPYRTLLALLDDVRKVERTKGFSKMLLQDTLTLLNAPEMDYTKANFSYGSTPYQSYLAISSSPHYQSALSLSRSSKTRPLVLGSSLGLLNFYVSLTSSLPSVGIELLPSLSARSRKLASTHSVPGATFVNADFLDPATDGLFNTHLVILTSMCWDSCLQSLLHKRLAALLPDGATVVDYTDALSLYDGENGRFEEVGRVEVMVSWSERQVVHVFVKRGERGGGGNKEEEKEEAAGPPPAGGEGEPAAEERATVPAPPATEENPRESKADSAPLTIASKDLDTPSPPPELSALAGASTDGRVSPVAKAVGVAAGVGVCGFIMAKFWRK